MKVLVVARGYLDKENPVGNFEFDQALALKMAGCDVRVLAFDARNVLRSKAIGVREYLYRDIKIYGIALPFYFLPKEIYSLISNNVACSFFQNHILNEWRPDIIHAHFGNCAANMVKTVEKYSIPFCVTEHFSGLNQPEPNQTYYHFAKKAYEKADLRIAVSNDFKDRLEQLTHLDFHVIGNLLDPDIFNDVFQISSDKRTDEQIHIISAGNLTKNKSFDLLLDVVAQLNHDVRLDIYGAGAEREYLQNKIQTDNLSGKVVLHDRVSRNELVERYQESDLFVLLSKKETFGVVFIEAMACGLPVVSSQCGGTDDIITDEKYGIIVDQADPICIAAEIDQMIDHLYDFDRSEISASTIDRFGYRAILSRLMPLYQECIENN